MTTDAAVAARRNAFARVPFTRLLGVRREYSEGGRARLVVDARPEFENVIGAMHGGIVATLLDVAMASAAVSKVDFEMTAVTLSMNSTFIRTLFVPAATETKMEQNRTAKRTRRGFMDQASQTPNGK